MRRKVMAGGGGSAGGVYFQLGKHGWGGGRRHVSKGEGGGAACRACIHLDTVLEGIGDVHNEI